MSKRLLVTDDAMIIREIIKDTASEAGWEIIGEACNGQEAAELYDKHQPDAVTLDLVMPEFDGLYALREIIDRHPDAKIIVVSAVDQTKVLKQALSLGAADFIVKPFTQDALVDSLEKLAT